jgi:ABC-type antimicrobial peptide transport system permease subunit
MVSPDYFATVGTKLLQGRTFAPLDSDPAAGVVIINKELAHTYFGVDNPLGRFITLGRNEDPRRIVGVVENSSYRYLQEPTTQTAFRPFEKGSEMLEASNLTFEVRARGQAGLATADVAEAIRSMDSTVSFHIETMEDRIAESLVREIALAKLATVLGALSLILAVAGLYGLLAYSVARRTIEIGVRMAMGATRAGVLRLVLRDAVRLTLGGLVAGVALFVWTARFATGLVHGVAPADPLAITVAALVMLGTALGAAFLPARQASRVDPIVAIRQD